MRHYDIFSIKEDVATCYFGKKELLYRLFLEAETTMDSNQKAILRKQISFITKPIPAVALDRYMNSALQAKCETFMEENQRIILLKDTGGYAAFYSLGDRLKLDAAGDYEAETAFFEILRAADPYLLAIDYSNGYSGWLKPVKKAHFIELH